MQGIVHLLLMYQPSNTFVHGVSVSEDEDAAPPEWNLIPGGDLMPWYTSLFEFSEAYPDNDGRLLVLMPCRLSFELYKLAHRVGLDLKAEWICNESHCNLSTWCNCY